MPKGGKREGAGRPLANGEPTKMRSIRMTDTDWRKIKGNAQKENMSIPEYIVKMCSH